MFSILRAAGWLTIAKLIQGATSVLATLVIARYLSPSTFGELSLAITTASFVATAAALGLEHIAIRELSKRAEAKSIIQPIITTLTRMRMFGAVGGVSLLLIASVSESASQYNISSLLLCLSLLPLAQVGDLSEWRLIASGHTHRAAIIVALVSPIAAVLKIGLVVSGGTVSALALALVVEWATRSLLLRLACRRLDAFAPIGSAPSMSTAIGVLQESMPLLLSAVAVFIYMRIDQFMIASMLGIKAVGLYSAAVTLSEIPLILPVLLLRAALPTLTEKSRPDSFESARMLELIMRHAFYIHAFIAVVLLWQAQPLIDLLYGEDFLSASDAFRIQVLAGPFVSLGVLSTAWLVLQRRTIHAVHRTIVGAVANVALNLMFIPEYGIAGAAIATVCAQILSTYLVDFIYTETRPLFWMKTRAVLAAPRRLL